MWIQSCIKGKFQLKTNCHRYVDILMYRWYFSFDITDKLNGVSMRALTGGDIPGVETTAWKFFSCSWRMRSDFSLPSFSSPRTLCTYWLLRNLRSAFSCSSFRSDAFNSGDRRVVSKPWMYSSEISKCAH